jgi:hypothetical protein
LRHFRQTKTKTLLPERMPVLFRNSKQQRITQGNFGRIALSYECLADLLVLEMLTAHQSASSGIGTWANANATSP